MHVADVAEITARLAAVECSGEDGSGCFNSQLNAFAKVAEDVYDLENTRLD